MTIQKRKILPKKIFRKHPALGYGVLALVMIIAAVAVVQIAPGTSDEHSASTLPNHDYTTNSSNPMVLSGNPLLRLGDYIITYDAGDGSGSMTDNPFTVSAGSTHTVQANSFTAPAGMGFLYWKDNSNNISNPGDVITPTSDMVLTAQWGDTWEIWNWNDLSKVIDKQTDGITNFVVMQDLGVPDQTGTYGDGTGCTVHTGNEKYGWYGYEGFEGTAGGEATAASDYEAYVLSVQSGHGWNQTTGWIALGNSAKPFTSKFDGNNQTITGLWINTTANDYGLFGIVNGNAAIHDLTLASPAGGGLTIIGGTDVGSVVGNLGGSATIYNLVNGVDVLGAANVGGIVGLVSTGTIGVSGGTMYNEGTVTATASSTTQASGGIIGIITGKPTITPGSSLINTGPVYGTNCVGGIIGRLNTSSLSAKTTFSSTVDAGVVTVSNTGAITGTSSYAGGLFGYVDCTNITVGNYTNTVMVSGNGIVGGVIGFFTTGNFGIDGGVIVNEGKVTGTGQSVGGILGRIDGAGANVVNNATYTNLGTVTGGTYVGGVIGFLRDLGNYSATTFSDTASPSAVGVSNTVAVSGVSQVGGLFGWLEKDAIVTNLTNTVSVTATVDYAGGIAGYMNTPGAVTNAHNTGTVTAGGSYAGGISGYMYGGSINASYNIGAIVAGNYAGGIVGFIAGGSVANVYNLGSVTSAATAGGVAGLINPRNGSTTNSYNAGVVSGATVGGFDGEYTKGTISNCYFDTTTSQVSIDTGSGAPTGITGVPTLGLASDSTLPTGFSSTVWAIGLGGKITYPYLIWQTTTGMSNDIGCTGIALAADTTAAAANPTVSIVLPASGAATKVFNTFGTNFAPLTAGQANTVSTTAAAGTLISVGVMSESDIVMFSDEALESFAITYDDNGGTAGPGVINNVLDGTYNLESAVPTHAQSGGRNVLFVGWTTDSSVSGQILTHGDTVPTIATNVVVNGADVTLYAVWEYEEDNNTVPAPTINQPAPGDTEITGTGIPGATINLTLPDGTDVQTTVDQDSNWSYGPVDPLVSGDQVSASQTVGSDTSGTATVVVSAAPPAPKNYYITATADSNSTIDPIGLVVVSMGGNQTFTFSVANGYHIVSVLVDGIPLSQAQMDAGSYTFKKVMMNHSIQVSSASGPAPRTTVSLTIDISPQNGGYAEYSLDEGQTFTQYTNTVTVSIGSNVSVRADANDGFDFQKWMNGSTTTTTSDMSLGTMSSPVHLTLYFMEKGQDGNNDNNGGIWWWILVIVVLLILIGLLLWFLLFYRRYYDVIKPENVSVIGDDRVHRKSEYAFTINGGFSGVVSYRLGDEEDDLPWEKIYPDANGKYIIPKGVITDDVTIWLR